MFDDFFITQSGFIIPNPHKGTSEKAAESKTLEEIENDLLENVKQKQRAAREALYELTVFYNNTGRKDRALALLEYLTENTEEPGDKGFYYFTNGQYMEQIGDYAKAVEYYQKAFTLEPGDPRRWYFIHNNLGYSLNQLGRFNEGERACRTAIKIDPRTHNAYKNLAIALEGQGKYLEAAENYIQATQYNAADSRALHHLANLLKQQPQLLTENPELEDRLVDCQVAVVIAQEIFQNPQEDNMAKYSLVRIRAKGQEGEDVTIKLQRQLQISRERARALGIQAVEIIEEGHYLNAAGRKIQIKDAVSKSIAGTVTYSPGIDLPLSSKGNLKTKISVDNTTTLAATRTLIAEGYKPVALNMASATSPGGGFLSGGRAQEEYLCRSTALYACLRNNPMYSREEFHANPFYDDYVIYSPDVVVFRDDDGELMDRPHLCSIITSPAVFAAAVHRYMPKRAGEIEGAMWKRILKLLAVAHAHGHEALVLGAWGCGAFGNDGQMVAGLFKKALGENYAGSFKKVVFAITDWSPEKRYIGPFQEEFGG